MQTEMNKLFAEGGVMQEGGTVDPVSGNDVPPGAMKEEVRDDIDAKLSEGEFVFPADVVRYVGLETLMKIRDKAKMGLKKMEEIGQMGNAEEVPDGEALHGSEDEMDDDTFSSEIDSILSEDDGGEDRGYAAGGYVAPDSEKLYKGAPLKGFEMVAMTNSSGNIVYIPFVNGQPQLSVPAGYSVKKEGAITKSTDDKTTGITTGDGVNTTTGLYDAGGDSTAGPAAPATDDAGLAVAAPNVSPTAVSVAATVMGMVTGLPVNAVATVVGKSTIANAINSFSNSVAANANQAQAAALMGLTPAEAATTQGIAATASVVDSMSSAPPGQATATTGQSGTGGAAASAASNASSAAAAAGHSVEGQAAAAQAAADATIGGQSPSAAATAAANAAASVDNGQAAEGGNTAANAAAADASAAGVGVGGVGAGNDSGGISAGEGLAKGGFVSKPKKATKQKGLASRK